MLCVIKVFTKYESVKALEDKKIKTILTGYIKIGNESKGKPNKLCVYQEKEFYNSPMQKWLDDNDILMYSTHNEGKSVAAARFIKVFRTNVYKIITTNKKILNKT